MYWITTRTGTLMPVHDLESHSRFNRGGFICVSSLLPHSFSRINDLPRALMQRIVYFVNSRKIENSASLLITGFYSETLIMRAGVLQPSGKHPQLSRLSEEELIHIVITSCFFYFNFRSLLTSCYRAHEILLYSSEASSLKVVRAGVTKT